MNKYKVLRGLASILLMMAPPLAKAENLNTKLPVQRILKPMPENLPKFVTPEDVTYTIIPPASGLNYRISVFDISEPFAGHSHEYQTQNILVLDGKLKVQRDDEEPLTLEASDTLQILPNVWHVLEPVNGPVRYLSTYFFDATQHPTGLPFPEDVNFIRRQE